MYSPVCVGVKIFSTFWQNSREYFCCNSKNVLYITVIDIGYFTFLRRLSLNCSIIISDNFLALDNKTFSNAE